MSHIGDAEQTDWQAYANDRNHPLRARIGFAADPAPLRFTGPLLCLRGETLLPAPASLLRTPEGRMLRLALGPATDCDIGRARLPVLTGQAEGAKPAESAWLTPAGFQAFQRGETPPPDSLITIDKLLCEEPRLGIALASHSRSAEPGMLYQTRHLRLHPEVCMRLGVDGLDEAALASLPAMVRLGGEGRLASIARTDDALLPAPSDHAPQATGLILTTLTPAQPGPGPALPAGFEPDQANGHDVWRGRIQGVALTIHGAACGKPLQLGGWNMAGEHRGPTPVRSLLPPGSLWYCTADELPAAEAAAKLHLKTIHPDERWGYGLLAASPWPQNENLGEIT